ncbi:MAG: DUF521 domain-containing protein [Erysipelotrichaceae bacterium]|nr:DUF521 domain-containing protein [Erysipelotrichaceae bacterium]
MILNDELLAIQNGEQGEAMRKVLNTLIMYGEAFDAKRMVKITSRMGHCVIGTGTMTWTPVFDLMQQLLEGGAIPQQSYTTDPRGIEPGVPATLAQKLMYKVIFSNQKRMEQLWQRMGIKDQNAYTCACYMDEVGNTPQMGDILGWAESSAVSYANSVLGARCNRNSGILELMSMCLGYVPEFGLLTDEGRKADWIIEVKTKKLPEPQLLGSAIGFKCVEDVPWIKGLTKWLGTEMTPEVKDYLKDMGAAMASNGSVGLYHIPKLTPEAKELGRKLVNKGAQKYVITDDELKRVKEGYPILWDRLDAKPELAFAGCPHFSLNQLLEWRMRLETKLKEHGLTKVTVPTIFCTPPDVRKRLETEFPGDAAALKDMGVTVSGLCPLSYTSNPLTDKTHIITCSNKLRYYSKARFYSEADLIEIITGGTC